MVHIYDITLSVMSQWRFLSMAMIEKLKVIAQGVHINNNDLYSSYDYCVMIGGLYNKISKVLQLLSCFGALLQ